MQAVRVYIPEPRSRPATTDWRHINPPVTQRLNVSVAAEKLKHTMARTPEHFRDCNCQPLLSIIQQAEDDREKFLHVEVIGERVNENGIKLVRFTCNGNSFEIGRACFEGTELSS